MTKLHGKNLGQSQYFMMPFYYEYAEGNLTFESSFAVKRTK